MDHLGQQTLPAGARGASPDVLDEHGRLDRWFAQRLRDRHPAVRALLVGLAGYLVITPVLLVLGLVLVALEGSSWLVDTDREVARWFASARTPLLDPAARAASRLTGTATVLALVAGSCSVLAVLARWRALTVILTSVLVELAAFLSVTFLVARPRPDVAAGQVPVTLSYPSGHAAMSVALYGALTVALVALSHLRPLCRAAPVVVVLVALTVSLSRIYLGLHYLSDVVVGLALGAASLAVGVVATRTVPSAPLRGGRNDEP